MSRSLLNKHQLSDAVVSRLEIPATGQKIYLDAEQEHFGVRVLVSGSRAWILERRLDGKTYRRTLGDASGPRALTRKQALKEFAKVNGALLKGDDDVGEERQERRAQAEAASEATFTFEAALTEYVQKKQRQVAGQVVGLKPRTAADYLTMVAPSGVNTKTGAPTQPGLLYPLADKRMRDITGPALKELHDKIAGKAPRRAGYAMQIVRAVFNWHGITIPDNPMGKSVAARDRVILKTTGNRKNPIPSRMLGAWWCAASSFKNESADYYRFQMLTGCRAVEIMGDNYGNEPIRVRDIDLVQERIVRRNTKNRRDHVIMLSRQAMEIVRRQMEGKKPSAQLFGVVDPKKTLHAINRTAGMPGDAHTGHDMRSTFASIATGLANGETAAQMINHASSGNVTQEHYVVIDDERLRRAWQDVADYIETAARSAQLAAAPSSDSLPDDVETCGAD